PAHSAPEAEAEFAPANAAWAVEPCGFAGDENDRLRMPPSALLNVDPECLPPATPQPAERIIRYLGPTTAASAATQPNEAMTANVVNRGARTWTSRNASFTAGEIRVWRPSRFGFESPRSE